ncbi:Insulin-like growth factor-binding protein complex acid labile subunit [Eufriesea mexicana]|uniref:Insulin-like growth factor-binding protein complex acid labile subunit n=1 Tax=Eufriesea mexicana TaxID=516756 RepID=A0A310SJ34_9HYME|nr:Insulin-like growth factor-binding protein complex acid labile subunit [Eufriesea mexicana]
MWLPFMLLALMASGSACPDLCECHQSAVDGEQPAFVHVKCRGRAPGLSELPIKTGSLTVDGADEYEVIGFFEELDASDSLNDFGVIGTLNEFNVNDTLDELDLGNSTVLPYLDELSVTNCSLVFLNVSWHGLERVRALNLSCNNLTRLNDVIVGRVMNMSELTRFDLSDNSLTDVSAGAFRTLAGLVRLSLRRNAISNVHEDAFRGLDRLEFLDLSDNRLADLPDSALTPLYSLQKLDLSGNQLQVLGARWFESLDRLRELDVSRNGLARAASGTLQPLPGLSILKLAENPLKERDVSLLLGTGRRLETVDASRTGLARVPAALTRSVRALRLAGNKLTTIRGGDLDSYPLLRILDISENRLTDIEDDEVLEELDISGNVLVKIPGSLPNSLTNLKLQRNAITALKIDDLQGLYNLKSLMLNDNDINEIEVGALGQLPVLEQLDLSDNPIKTLPANTLSGPSNLAKLRMSGLTSLQRKQEEQSDMAFPVPTPERLVYLDVSRSPVLARQLLADDAALSACKSLIELNLSRTNVTSLRFDLPYMLPQLRIMDLSGNHWDCTEDLYWVGEWLRQHEQLNKDVEPGQCDTPEELSGSSLYELPSPPSPLPTTQPTTTPIASTLSILSPIERTSYFNNLTVSSNLTDINVTKATVSPVDESISINDTTPSSSRTDSSQQIDSFRNVADNSTNNETRPSSATLPGNETRFYDAPTSFRNVTTSSPSGQKERKLDEKVNEIDETSAEIKNSIIDVAGLSYRGTTEGKPSIIRTEEDSDPGTFDNRIDGKRQKGRGPSKLSVSPSKITSFKLSKLAPLKEGAGGKKTAEKYSKRLNNLTKENLVLGNTPDSNTIAEELNSRATDSDARVSEALSAGAHPGMLVLAGAALGAAAALTVVLSRRATVRRRDRDKRLGTEDYEKREEILSILSQRLSSTPLTDVYLRKMLNTVLPARRCQIPVISRDDLVIHGYTPIRLMHLATMLPLVCESSEHRATKTYKTQTDQLASQREKQLTTRFGFVRREIPDTRGSSAKETVGRNPTESERNVSTCESRPELESSTHGHNLDDGKRQNGCPYGRNWLNEDSCLIGLAVSKDGSKSAIPTCPFSIHGTSGTSAWTKEDTQGCATRLRRWQ